MRAPAKPKPDVHMLDDLLRVLGRPKGARQPRHATADRASDYVRGLHALGWLHVDTVNYTHTFQKGCLTMRVGIGDHIEVGGLDREFKPLPAKARRNLILAAQGLTEFIAAREAEIAEGKRYDLP